MGVWAIPKNTATAVERRIPFLLFDETDLITPEDITVTGVKVDLSFGGAADAPSTNDIVKVDGTRGMYYLELTQTEANNANGPVQGYLKPTGCAACYIEAQIGPAGLYGSTVVLEDGSLTNAKFADNAIDADVLASNTIANAKIADGALTAAKLASDTITAAKIAADAFTAAKFASDVTTEFQSGLATAAALATVDTVVDAIQAKTDSLTFTQAGHVDANVQRVNDVAITGNGSSPKFGV